MKKILFTFAALMLLSFAVSAENLYGPASPCVSCEQLNARTEPYNGVWYNPDQSGTGFSIDVQNGKVFGAYYGYDEQGKQIWLTFVGDLVASDEPNIMWTMSANLTQFEDGNALNQTYAFPDITDYQGQIHFKFTQKNHALFSVNNGEEHNIVPIIFGVQASADFPEQTSYEFPELTGLWTFVNYFKIEDVPEQATTVSEVLFIREKRFRDVAEGGLEIYYSVIFFSHLEGLFVGEITCQIVNMEGQSSNPECNFVDNRFSADPFNPPTYRMSVGGLGAFRIFGELDDGGTFEAFKINSIDYLKE